MKNQFYELEHKFTQKFFDSAKQRESSDIRSSYSVKSLTPKQILALLFTSFMSSLDQYSSLCLIMLNDNEVKIVTNETEVISVRNLYLELTHFCVKYKGTNVNDPTVILDKESSLQKLHKMLEEVQHQIISNENKTDFMTLDDFMNIKDVKWTSFRNELENLCEKLLQNVGDVMQKSFICFMRSYKDIFGVQIIPLVHNNSFVDTKLDNNRVFENKSLSDNLITKLTNSEENSQSNEFKDPTVSGYGNGIIDGHNCENGQQPETASLPDNNSNVDDLTRSLAGISVDENSKDAVSVSADDIPHPNLQNPREEKVEIFYTLF